MVSLNMIPNSMYDRSRKSPLAGDNSFENHGDKTHSLQTMLNLTGTSKIEVDFYDCYQQRLCRN
jgi:hypothetical protein